MTHTSSPVRRLHEHRIRTLPFKQSKLHLRRRYLLCDYSTPFLLLDELPLFARKLSPGDREALEPSFPSRPANLFI